MVKREIAKFPEFKRFPKQEVDVTKLPPLPPLPLTKREIKARNKKLISMIEGADKFEDLKSLKDLELNYDYLKPKEKKIRYSLGKERKILLAKKNEAEERTKNITSKAIQGQIEGINDKLKNDAAMFNTKLREYKNLHNIKGKLKPFTSKEYHAFMRKKIVKRIIPPVVKEI